MSQTSPIGFPPLGCVNLGGHSQKQINKMLTAYAGNPNKNNQGEKPAGIVAYNSPIKMVSDNPSTTIPGHCGNSLLNMA